MLLLIVAVIDDKAPAGKAVAPDAKLLGIVGGDNVQIECASRREPRSDPAHQRTVLLIGSITETRVQREHEIERSIGLVREHIRGYELRHKTSLPCLLPAVLDQRF